MTKGSLNRNLLFRDASQGSVLYGVNIQRLILIAHPHVQNAMERNLFLFFNFMYGVCVCIQVCVRVHAHTGILLCTGGSVLPSLG